MKKIVSIMAVVVLAASCQFVSVNGNAKDKIKVEYSFNNEVVIDTLDLAGFSAIVVSGQGDIDFVQAPEFLVVLQAKEGIAEKLDCYVKNGKLYLDRKKQERIKEHYRFTIHAPLLTAITVNGAADLKLGPYAANEDLEIEVNGAGDLDCREVCVPVFKIAVNGAGDIDASNMNVERLSVEVNGAGDAKLSGVADEVKLRLSGAGDIDARGLKANKINKEKNGVGKIRL